MFQMENAKGKIFCGCFLYSPNAGLQEVLNVSWAYSRTPIGCACWILA